MLLIRCGLYLGLLALLGYAFISALVGREKRHWAEVAGLSFAAGCGILPLILFGFSLAAGSPNSNILILIGVLAIATTALLGYCGNLLVPVFPCKSNYQWNAWLMIRIIAGGIIIAAILNVAVSSLTPELADVDAFGNWMFKAKFLVTHPLLPMPVQLVDPSLSYTHQDYPLDMPLLVAGMYAAIGQVIEQFGKAYLLPCYLSLIGITFGSLRRMLQLPVALAITAVFIAAPIVVQHAGMAVAELPLLMFLMTSLSLLLQWMETGEKRDLIASAAFAAFAAFSKNEGLALLPLIGFTAFVFTLIRRESNRWKDLSISTIVAIILISPWLIYRMKLPRTHEDYGGKLTKLSTLIQTTPRLGQVLPAFFEQFIELHNAGLLWLLLGTSAAIGWRAFRRLPVLALWGLLLAHLGLYVITFMVTPWDLSVLLPMISPKLLMHASVTATLLVGLHIAYARPASRGSTELAEV